MSARFSDRLSLLSDFAILTNSDEKNWQVMRNL